MTIPPFDSVQDGDRITIVGTARVMPNCKTVLTIETFDGDSFNLGSLEYAECVTKVERATWNEVTA